MPKKKAAKAASSPRRAEARPPAPEAPNEGGFSPSMAALADPLPIQFTRSCRDATDAALAAASVFSPAESAVLRDLNAWPCQVGVGGSTWDLQVRTLDRGAPRTALFLHGLGPDRSGAFFAKWWCVMAVEGYNVLALDMPGHGRSCEKPLPTRSGHDGDLVLAVLAAFGAGPERPVTCFADAGGVQAFLLALRARPALFGGHHVLLNPIVSDTAGADALKAVMEAEGIDLFVYIAETWGKGDQPMNVGLCGKFFEYCEAMPDRVEMVMLKCPDVHGIVVGQRPPEYMVGDRVPVKGVARRPAFYMLRPSDECIAEVMGYMQSPRKQPVVVVDVAAPSKTALEMGKVNENFRVFVRVRPLLKREEERGAVGCLKVSDVEGFPRAPPPQRIRVKDPRPAGQDKQLFAHHLFRGEFVFDRVFESDASQVDVFESVGKPLVEAALEGLNVTMFAYGQTGTGKTFTMDGPPGDEGLMHHSIHMLFAGLGGGKAVSIQYVQLYNADFKDLLEPEAPKKLTVEEGPAFMTVRGAAVLRAASADALLRAVAKGAAYRASGKTNMNDASSRSHAILLVMIAEEAKPEAANAMYLVDLAGSERTKRSGVEGQRFTEATAINTALSALGRVVTNLVANDGKPQGHISYKDNPLTYLLKCGIGGRSRTALICCITSAEDSMEETIQTLRFALQASHVKNRVANKEKKDRETAKADAIAEAGNALALSEGRGVVPLKTGDVPVLGDWGDGGPAVICLHDFGKTGDQFAGVIEHLKGKARVLAPTFRMATEKNHDALVDDVKALLDWLGVARPLLFGRDAGAVAAACFKMRYPARAGALVLENRRDNLPDEKAYKAHAKRDPNAEVAVMGTQWMWFAGDAVAVQVPAPTRDADMKTLKGKPLLLWPSQARGRPDVRGTGLVASMGKFVAKGLRTELTNSHQLDDAALVARMVKLLK